MEVKIYRQHVVYTHGANKLLFEKPLRREVRGHTSAWEIRDGDWNKSQWYSIGADLVVEYLKEWRAS